MSQLFISRYGAITSANTECNYPMDVKSINCITIVEDDVNKVLQIFLLDERKVIFSRDKLDETDKLKKS